MIQVQGTKQMLARDKTSRSLYLVFWLGFVQFPAVTVTSSRNGIEGLEMSNSLKFDIQTRNEEKSSFDTDNRNSFLNLFDRLHTDHSNTSELDNVRDGAADIISPWDDSGSRAGNDIFYHDLQLASEMRSTCEYIPRSNIQSKCLKTGTTIVGCLANQSQAVILAADTRATSNTIVADKRCEKVHRLAPNVFCCGAGTSGDIDALVQKVKYTFLLRNRINGDIGNIHHVGSESNDLDLASVHSICKFIRSQLFPAQGEIGANLVIGGYEYNTGNAVLAAIHPHGSMDTTIPFTALGSGGLAAMSVLEANYNPNITLEEAKLLAVQAVKAGIDNDLGSGSQVDICVIKRDGVHYQRAILEEEKLVLTDRDNISADILYDRHAKSNDGILSGVNGFGSLPYRIRSRNIIVENESRLEREKRSWMRKKLGLKVREK